MNVGQLSNIQMATFPVEGISSYFYVTFGNFSLISLAEESQRLLINIKMCQSRDSCQYFHVILLQV